MKRVTLNHQQVLVHVKHVYGIFEFAATYLNEYDNILWVVKSLYDVQQVHSNHTRWYLKNIKYHPLKIPLSSKARFKRRATAVPNSIDRIKFDFSTAVARRLKPSRATAVPNSIHKL